MSYQNLQVNDTERVTQLLGRAPMGEFTVVVRRSNGEPVVVRNHPLLNDGTPMPTLYWLCDPQIRSAIGTLESEGGVNRVEAEIGIERLAEIHADYAAERNNYLEGESPLVPTGGVGGTRLGVKCLHAHYAFWLAGGNDDVGEWTHVQLQQSGIVDEDWPERTKK